MLGLAPVLPLTREWIEIVADGHFSLISSVFSLLRGSGLKYPTMKPVGLFDYRSPSYEGVD